MRFRNRSGVSFLGLGGLVFGADLRAFVAAVFFARDEAAFFVRDEVDVVAERFLRVEL
jgi:hypothetical protein